MGDAKTDTPSLALRLHVTIVWLHVLFQPDCIICTLPIWRVQKELVPAGTLPAAWGDPGGLPSLIALAMEGMPITGPLPAAWAGSNSLPSLQAFANGDCPLSGSLPEEWGGLYSLRHLTQLELNNCTITGEICPG